MALAFGPIAFAPLSEYWGRRPVFLASFLIYTVFTAACGLAQHWGSFLFFRFMLGCAAAAPQTVSGGLFCDIYPDLRPRGMAVTLLGLTSNVGPLLGPITSGFVSTKGWQWQFWCALILAAANWPMLLLMPETFAPILNGYATEHDTSQDQVYMQPGRAAAVASRSNTKALRTTLQNTVGGPHAAYPDSLRTTHFLHRPLHPLPIRHLLSVLWCISNHIRQNIRHV